MSSRLCFSVVILVVAAGALAFRLPHLKQRPMHTDEAVHAEIFKDLLEKGQYEYDPREYHGPTLNYFTLPIAWLGSAKTLVQTNETILRLVPVLFGVGVVLLFCGTAEGLGKLGAIIAALLTAISPALVFYNRYYIQESQLVFFTFLVVVAGWRYARSRKIVWALLAGVGLGLMQATKETCIIAYGSLLAALLLTAIWYRRSQDSGRPIRSFINQKHLAAAIGAALFAAVLFFTSFFQNPRGPLDAILTYGTYFNKAGEPGIHNHPWYYYLQMLLYIRYYDGPRWSEVLIVGLAVLGFVRAFFGRSADGNLWFVRLIGFYTLFMIVIYSAIPYKTPWCMMGFLHGMILLAGWGAAGLIRVAQKLPVRIGLIIILAGGAVHLGWQSWRANFKYYESSLNPYVYAQTVSDVMVMVDRVHQLSESLEDRETLDIMVICPDSDYWPLPWYLRKFKNIYWRDKVYFEDKLTSVIIISSEAEDDLVQKIYERTPLDERRLYVNDLYPREIWLRPDVALKLYITNELWTVDSQRRQPSVKELIQSKQP